MKKIIKLFACVTLLQLQAFAQSPEEIKSIFPGNDFVYLNYEQELNLFLKDDVPVADRKTNIDMLMLTDKNVNMLSKYTVYHSGYNELTQFDAYTRVPSGNKFKNLKVIEKKTSTSTSNSIFYDDTKETTFNFPGLTEHAIAHVDHTLFNKDAHLLTAFYLPVYLPVVNGSYKVKVPNSIKIKYVVKNDPAGIFSFSEEKKSRETIYKWTSNNTKASEYFANAPDMRYYQPHVIVYVTSYEAKNGTQNFLSSIKDLYKWNYDFISELNTSPDPHLKQITDSLVQNESGEMNKARKVYQWVQQHIKYVAFENGLEGFRPRQAGEVCSKRYGDCKDMSSIITQMLRMAGIKAYYTWIGTRDLPYTYSEIPLPLVDNHMISTAFIDGKWLFLDGTDPNAKFDMPPAFIQGKEAMLSITSEEYKILTVPVAAPERSMITDSTFISITDDGIKGFANVKYDGYFGKEVYTSLLYSDAKETKEYVNKKMSKGSNKFIMGNYSIAKKAPEENIANITGEFQLPGYGKRIGNEYYINMHVEKILEDRSIDIEKRKVPMEIDFNYCIRQYHILEIPKGYTISYLPKNFTFENDLIKIDIYYKVENEKVIAAQEIKNKKLMIMPSEFEEWNKPMKAIQPYYKELLVLEKK
jgi:Domain of Unknown Function with PDB structure (DUF3857)/Transglutaminase-like superfamily